MNPKSACNIVALTRRVIFSFSKDPFDKFNRKKGDSPSGADNQRLKSGDKGKSPKGDKNSGYKYKGNFSWMNQFKNAKQKKQMDQTSSGFQNFNLKKKTDGKQTHEGKQNSKTHFETKREDQEHNESNIEKDGFSRFSRRQREKHQQQPENQNKQNHQRQDQNITKIQADQENTDAKNKQKEEIVVLRKPRDLAKTRLKQREDAIKLVKIDQAQIKAREESKIKQIFEANNKETEEEIKAKETEAKEAEAKEAEAKEAEQARIKEEELVSLLSMKQQEEEAQKMQQKVSEQPPPIIQQQIKKDKWQQFQKLIQQWKNEHSRNTSLLRFQRMNLIAPDPKQTNFNKKQTEVGPSQFVNHKKNFIKLMVAGVALILLSSNQYFSINQGKEVTPQYLQQALFQNRIAETWFQNTQIETNNEQSSKGKNIQKFAYIRQNNGDISFCISNVQFQIVWIKMILDHNTLQDARAPIQVFSSQQTEQLKMQTTHNQVIISPQRQSKKSSIVSDTRSILSMVLLYFFIKSIMDVSKSGRGGKGGKGATNLFDNEKSHRFRQVIKVTFQDVVGMQKAKQQIVQFIDFLKFPAKYNKLGARIPKGALLTGPPGTGKTMIAKACAGQSKVPFFTISGSEFIEMYVGVGAQRVRNLFKQAKQAAPSIIFIDEIDAVGKKRSNMGGGNDERDTTLNQLLVQMDGFDADTNVIVFAATNQKEVLDAALTRPGRFDRLIQIDLPDLEGRKQIFQVHLKPLVLDPNIEIKVYAKRLATLTPGFSGADIKNVCNEAAIIAARNNKELVSIMDFQLATQRIIGGVEKKSQLITPQTRKIVAYHECGHGVVSWFIQNANPLLKLTIIPRSKGALGFAQYLPNEHQMYTKVKLLDQICVILGGRIAEQVFFKKISTGASDDLSKAYQIAKSMVTQYGFTDKLGWIQYEQTEYAKQYSKDIENKIDQQIMNIMNLCSARTRALVNEKKELIDQLASKLLEQETIDQNHIEAILGVRPFKSSKQHEEYIKEKKKLSEQILTFETKKEEEKTADIADNKVSMKRANYLL